MTYLFIAISLSIINALSNTSISVSELLITNIAVVGFTFVLEKLWMRNELMKRIIYEKIDLVKPEKRDLLLADLKERTGLNIHRLEIGKIDFLRDITEIKVYFYSSQTDGNFCDNDNGDDDDD